MLLPLRHPRTWLVIGWAMIALAVLASLLPGQKLPVTGINDKFEHALAYTVLALWFAGIYPRSRYLIIGIGLVLLGIAIEWAQGAMSLGRQSDFRDVIANTGGIALGLTLAMTWLGGWAQRIDGWTRDS
ncbi:MAG: VanZ family protein [Steroidobacter sp.]